MKVYEYLLKHEKEYGSNKHLCSIIFEMMHGRNCDCNVTCDYCELFNPGNLLEILNIEYKEPIKLNIIELEILKSFKKIYGGKILFCNFDLLMLLYEYDYFNQVDVKLSLDEIIERSEGV